VSAEKDLERRRYVMVEWPEHGRHGWVGEIVGTRETAMGPMVEVRFGPHESGLYQHEYLRVVVSQGARKARG
jgi:hypothetical protein